MNKSLLKIRLEEFPLSKKILAIGSFLLILSVILPWYKDIDGFKTGNTFLGITGPVYFAGYMILITNFFSAYVLFSNFSKRKIPAIIQKITHLNLITLSVSALMILNASSIYFHPKFGVNISQKTMGMGMVIGLFGLFFLFVGNIFSVKKVKTLVETERQHESLNRIETETEKIPYPGIPVPSLQKQERHIPISEPRFAPKNEKLNVIINENHNPEKERFSYFAPNK